MSNMPRQPRKLHYLKCHRCRIDRQKCTPTDRPWPGRKCDRCIKFNYPCSASVTARGDQAKGLNVSQASQVSQPVPPSFNVDGLSNGVGHAGDQSDRSDFHALRNLFNSGLKFHTGSPTDGPRAETWNPFDNSITRQSSPAVSPRVPPLTKTPPGDQARPECAKFFVMLQHAIWGPTEVTPADPPVNPPAVSLRQAFYALMDEKKLRLTRSLYHRLKYRECLVQISRVHKVKIQQEIAGGMSRGKAVKAIVTDAIANEMKQLSEEDDNGLTPVQHILLFTRMLREGDRWRELVDTVGSREILLMDSYHPNCPRNRYTMESYNETAELVTLECCPDSCPSMSAERIIAQGTDELFEEFKKTLLAPELQLERTCQRLSGLVRLIYRLFKNSDPEDPMIKWISAPLHPSKVPLKDSLSDLDSFLISEIPRRIKDVFGSDPFPLPSEWNNNSDDDDDDDDDDGDGDGDDDGSFPNDVFNNSEGQHHAEFSEDFCTQFSSTNPFASI